MKLRRLPDAELEVMQALWSASEPVPRSWLEERFSGHNWTASTVNTYLSRLGEKGFLTVERRGKTNYYTPVVSLAEYQAFESRSVLHKLFGSSVKTFLAALAGPDGLSDEEARELQSYLDEQKKGGNDP